MIDWFNAQSLAIRCEIFAVGLLFAYIAISCVRDEIRIRRANKRLQMLRWKSGTSQVRY